MKENILEFKNVNFSYGKKEVLKNVSFNIKEGSFFVLLGLNGAGKSTIFPYYKTSKIGRGRD